MTSMAYELTEEKLMGMLNSALQKAGAEGKSPLIGIYGGSEENQRWLFETVFVESFLDNCVFLQSEADLTAAKHDVLWTFEDITSPNAPCFFINELAMNEVLTLIHWTFDNLSGSLRKSFVKHQKLDIDLKEKYANTIITQHCAASFGIGFIPIPFADAPALVLNEITLMGRILDVYGLADVQMVLKTIGVSTLIGNLLTMLGKGLVGRLLKFIPVLGSVVGGIINGTTATTVTLAFGKSVSKVVKQLCKSAIEKNLSEFEYVAKNFSSAVAGTAVACVESGMATAEDYEKSFDSTELTIADFEKHIQRGNELFQKFLDKNAELDNEFDEHVQDGEKKSGNMWDAINKI